MLSLKALIPYGADHDLVNVVDIMQRHVLVFSRCMHYCTVFVVLHGVLKLPESRMPSPVVLDKFT